MKAIEFITGLSSTPVLKIPAEIAARLPKTGQARVIVLTENDAEDAVWHQAAYEQFLRDDPPEDSVYDACR
jgi:hypothetical protein